MVPYIYDRSTSRERIGQIGARTLIIHGDADQLVPTENAPIFAKSIVGSRLVILSHASHIFVTDQPEASHREILAFLSGRKRE